MSLKAQFMATCDQDRFLAPSGWDFTIYSFDPKNFWYSKTNLPVSESCEIVRYDFRSRVRFRAGQKKNGLQINFIDSYSTTASRLQGMGKIDSIVMITLGGHDWDGISDVGALGIELNFDEDATGRILSDQARFSLEMMAGVFGSKRSVVVRPSRAALRLKELALHFLGEFDKGAGVVYDDYGSSAEHPSLSIPSLLDDLSGFGEQTLLEMSRNVVEEISLGDMAGERLSSATRREIALKVEQILWESPLARDSDRDVDLNEICEQFKISRRTVQVTLQEQFGVGFVALRKMVRLHQLRAAIRSERGVKTVSGLGASFYRSSFGRLSAEYKDMFGALPSADLKGAGGQGRARRRGAD